MNRSRAELTTLLEGDAVSFAAPLLAAVAALPPGGGALRELPYEIERRLGRGGMATVYLARDLKHDRRVAIKVLDIELTARVEAQRFVQEIRLTARLQHPHVLGLLDSGVFGHEDDAFAGRPYYVMPYVEGDSLRARIATPDTLGMAEALRLLREVADALSYAHAQGVVHRDVKPDNILMSRDHAVVADFGIAKALVASGGADGIITDFDTLIGTPAYMSPEQATAGATVDHRADLYAWGVVAYEVLAKRHPFGRRVHGREYLAAHALETPPPLREVAPQVPQRVAAGEVDVVRLVNGGSFEMANNTIECRWPNAAGITVFSQFAEWPMEHAVVEDNDVLMSPAPGAVFGEGSAGITIKGYARGVVVRHNTVHGRARSALAVYAFRGGVPVGDTIIDNRLEGFQPALTDIFVGPGVSKTGILAPVKR